MASHTKTSSPHLRQSSARHVTSVSGQEVGSTQKVTPQSTVCPAEKCQSRGLKRKVEEVENRNAMPVIEEHSRDIEDKVCGVAVRAKRRRYSSDSDDLEVLQSATCTYEVLEFLGCGTFGQVVKCRKQGTTEERAVKILKNDPHLAGQLLNEIHNLALLTSSGAYEYNCVRAYEGFQYENNTCLVFETLHQDLHTFLKQQMLRPLPFNHIRIILHQVATALMKLKSLGLIHADLKPENIMIADPVKQPYKVKIIDFGLSHHYSMAKYPAYIQTRCYRAPEVMLGLPYWEAVDMWSLGCIAAEIFMGCQLYPGTSEYEQLLFITQTQGMPEECMLNAGVKTECFFRRISDCGHPSWRLKTPDEYAAETGMKPMDRRIYAFDCLDHMAALNLPLMQEEADMVAEITNRFAFVDFVKMLLTVDPHRRLGPVEALYHPFLTMVDQADFLHTTQTASTHQVCSNHQAARTEVNASSPCTVPAHLTSLPCSQGEPASATLPTEEHHQEYIKQEELSLTGSAFVNTGSDLEEEENVFLGSVPPQVVCSLGSSASLEQFKRVKANMPPLFTTAQSPKSMSCSSADPSCNAVLTSQEQQPQTVSPSDSIITVTIGTPEKEEKNVITWVLRIMAYRRFIFWIWKELGGRFNHVVPACVVRSIEEKFPTETLN
ncbi:homeodomain-interacting protein kinase 2-like [Protopterus annectens]|uniref:homeodomain-interacting protein kinase 2-like n=1 Tax=Protopterus annectens TaxID=7888 RepID=UPI001CFBFB1E|nr:homeodomain-interacting protein kinase 2-like [Protopterus annectens]